MRRVAQLSRPLLRSGRMAGGGEADLLYSSRSKGRTRSRARSKGRTRSRSTRRMEETSSSSSLDIPLPPGPPTMATHPLPPPPASALPPPPPPPATSIQRDTSQYSRQPHQSRPGPSRPAQGHWGHQGCYGYPQGHQGNRGLPQGHHSHHTQGQHSQGHHSQGQQLQQSRQYSSGQERWTRTWETLDRTPPGPKDLRFRVLSYNVLAQSLLEGHHYLYRDSPLQALEWDYRWAGLRREVADLAPDIVCLQEVQFREPDHFTSSYLPFFTSRGYRYVSKQRTGDKKDGCVIFFRGDIFDLDCVSEMEYRIPRVQVLDRDNVGLVCRLVPRGQAGDLAGALVIATTHLLYNPKREDIRLAQTALLLAEVDRLATRPAGEEGGYLPTVLTGDFNSEPASLVYQLLATGGVKYQGVCTSRGRRPMPAKLLPDALGLSDSCQWQVKLDQRGQGEKFQVGSGGLHHGLDLRSAYPPGPGVSTHQDYWTLVDYIFASRHPALRLAGRLRLPNPAQAERLPSLASPSDHLPLVADFLLTP